LDDVVDVIRFDQGLTVKLLRAANSAANAGALRATTARDALLRLGAAQALALAVASTTRSLIQPRIPAYRLDEGALWRHSVAAAASAEAAQEFCQVDVPPEAFTAALLHDVGKVVMGRFLSSEILGFIQRARESGGLSQLEAERQILGVHHGELGGLMAQHWNLPPRIVKGIIYHHEPEAGADVVCDLTYLANRVAVRLEAALDQRKLDFSADESVCERLGLAASSLEDVCAAASRRYAQVSQRYAAVGSGG
jgi:putative nucleotidyltransferase with HDIG domain